MAVQSDVEYFARLVDALEPWLDQVVIIGGWAHRLYRLHPLAQPLEYEPLGTFDTDIAVPLDLPATGGQITTDAGDDNTKQELRGELSTFVCEGQYSEGIIKILSSFLGSLNQTHQKAAWYAWFRDFRTGRRRGIGRSGDWRRRTGRHRGAERRQALHERLLKIDAHIFGLGPLSSFGALAKVISVDLAADPLGAIAAPAGTVS
jgi:hypothetical protein